MVCFNKALPQAQQSLSAELPYKDQTCLSSQGCGALDPSHGTFPRQQTLQRTPVWKELAARLATREMRGALLSVETANSNRRS